MPPSTSLTPAQNSSYQPSRIAFSESPIAWRGGDPTERMRVREVIVRLLESWRALDVAGYRDCLAANVTRINRAGGIARGVDAALASLPREWEEMEQLEGRVAIELAVENARIAFEGDLAFATYAVAVEGSKEIRWEFSDRWLICQVFSRDGEGQWRLLHQSLASDLNERGDVASFDFSFALPVTDLKRAVAFYTPLVGEAEHVGVDRAAFRVGSVRFILDAGGPMKDFARVRPDKPNGYVIFSGVQPAADLSASERLAPVKRFVTAEGDAASAFLDPAGNVFVILEESNSQSGAGPELELPNGFPPPATRALGAWMRADARAFAREFAPLGNWFENARSDLEDLAEGPDAIRRRADSQFQKFDRTSEGIAARLTIRDTAIVTAGKHRILSFRAALEGLGKHHYRDEAFVTMILEEETIKSLFWVRRLPEALVRGFDYVGYPTRNGAAGLTAVERFYRGRLDLGVPYSDESWFGFWSTHAVFGIFEADQATEGFPEPGAANGYPSFWVGSAREIEEYLRAQGCRFPAYPSISSGPGADRKAGYLDLLATDPDGNLILFTEYAGK